ncbi:MAG: hypothetical protein LBL66_05440, partial [Clostridiales bacterium]|nr:hypothetical protein [Clostridiales bacterium]
VAEGEYTLSVKAVRGGVTARAETVSVTVYAPENFRRVVAPFTSEQYGASFGTAAIEGFDRAVFAFDAGEKVYRYTAPPGLAYDYARVTMDVTGVPASKYAANYRDFEYFAFDIKYAAGSGLGNLIFWFYNEDGGMAQYISQAKKIHVTDDPVKKGKAYDGMVSDEWYTVYLYAGRFQGYGLFAPTSNPSGVDCRIRNFRFEGELPPEPPPLLFDKGVYGIGDTVELPAGFTSVTGPDGPAAVQNNLATLTAAGAYTATGGENTLRFTVYTAEDFAKIIAPLNGTQYDDALTAMGDAAFAYDAGLSAYKFTFAAGAFGVNSVAIGDVPLAKYEAGKGTYAYLAFDVYYAETVADFAANLGVFPYYCMSEAGGDGSIFPAEALSGGSVAFAGLQAGTWYTVFIPTTDRSLNTYYFGLGSHASASEFHVKNIRFESGKPAEPPLALYDKGIYAVGNKIAVSPGATVTGPGGTVDVTDGSIVAAAAGEYTVSNGYTFTVYNESAFAQIIAPLNGTQYDDALAVTGDAAFAYDAGLSAYKFTFAAGAFGVNSVAIGGALLAKYEAGKGIYAYLAFDVYYAETVENFAANLGVFPYYFMSEAGDDGSIFPAADLNGGSVAFASLQAGTWYTVFVPATAREADTYYFGLGSHAYASEFYVKNIRFESEKPAEPPLALYDKGIYAVGDKIAVPPGATVTGPGGTMDVTDDSIVAAAAGEYTLSNGYTFMVYNESDFARIIAPLDGTQYEGAFGTQGGYGSAFVYDSAVGAYRYSIAEAMPHSDAYTVAVTVGGVPAAKLSAYASYAYYAFDIQYVSVVQNFGFWQQGGGSRWYLSEPGAFIYDADGEAALWGDLTAGAWYTVYLTADALISNELFMAPWGGLENACDFLVRNLRFEDVLPAETLYRNGAYRIGARVTVPDGYAVTGPGGAVAADGGIVALAAAGTYTATGESGATVFTFTVLSAADYARIVVLLNGQTEAGAFTAVDSMFVYDADMGAYRFTAAAGFYTANGVTIGGGPAARYDNNRYAPYAYFAFDIYYNTDPVTDFGAWLGKVTYVSTQCDEGGVFAAADPGEGSVAFDSLQTETWYTVYIPTAASNLAWGYYNFQFGAHSNNEGGTDLYLKNMRFEDALPA